jgi:hypothetical protein
VSVHYRIRSAFRVAAAIAAVVLSSVGAALLGTGLLQKLKEGPFTTLAIIVGALVLSLGFLLGRLAWTGRISASIEEYGLDDPAEIAAHRDDARVRGLLEE